MVSTTEKGRRAERIIARRLQTKGYKILAMNWRTRRCEIDVIAYRNKCVYFVEVKYRKSTRYGAGLEYITLTKLRQMQYAAQSWTAMHQWSGAIQLCGAEVCGSGAYRIVELNA